jgi:hypothetical protein
MFKDVNWTESSPVVESPVIMGETDTPDNRCPLQKAQQLESRLQGSFYWQTGRLRVPPTLLQCFLLCTLSCGSHSGARLPVCS